MVVEKACELGVALYRPVITRRTIVDRTKSERLRAIVIEAAEQCGRTALPVMEEPVKLPHLLKAWPSSRRLFFADEAGGVPLAAAVAANPGPAALLIGPEGGFDDEERAAIRALPQAIGVSLGPRILRAETERRSLPSRSGWRSTAIGREAYLIRVRKRTVKLLFAAMEPCGLNRMALTFVSYPAVGA